MKLDHFAPSLAAAAVLIASCAGLTPAKAGTAGVETRVDALFSEWNKPDTPGCAVAVVQNGKIAYERGYGMANLEHSVRITPDTVFYIASVSKQFTAASVALLAQDGKITLDDDIRKYVPEIPVYDRPIVIRNLIHHTSGLRDYLGLWSDSGRSHADSIAEAEAIALIARQDGLDFTPGSQYRYSNSGYFLLSVIVKRASGKPLSVYADERIFKPLGMRQTHFHDDRTRIVRNRASSYFQREAKDGGGLGVYQTSYDLVGDGGLLTTVRDLYLWDQNFYHNILGNRSQAFIDELQSVEALSDGKPNAYAFGLVRRDYKGLEAIAHSGSFLAYNANYIRIPSRRLSAIALCNSQEANPSKLTEEVVDLYSGLAP